MPFIDPERRPAMHRYAIGLELPSDFEIQPGDLCYMFYKEMVESWKEEPRWTTAHNLFKSMLYDTTYTPDEHAAVYLAWQCFFHFHVIPYEEEKRTLNGDI